MKLLRPKYTIELATKDSIPQASKFIAQREKNLFRQEQKSNSDFSMIHLEEIIEKELTDIINNGYLFLIKTNNQIVGTLGAKELPEDFELLHIYWCYDTPAKVIDELRYELFAKTKEKSLNAFVWKNNFQVINFLEFLSFKKNLELLDNTNGFKFLQYTLK